MNIYLIQCLEEDVRYESYIGFVIVAGIELEVRQMADPVDQPAFIKEKWTKRATIGNVSTYTGPKTESFIVLDSYNHG